MATRNAPLPGAIEGGYRFLGGDASRPENWRQLPMGLPTATTVPRAPGALPTPPLARFALMRRHGVPADVALRLSALMRPRLS